MADAAADLRLGVEVLLGDAKTLVKGARVGLITHPAGVDRNLVSSVDLLHGDPDIDLVALFGPEHGIRGDAGAGDPVPDRIDARTGLPAYSLYGSTDRPTPEMLAAIDVLLVDVQDVGARAYTYLSTLLLALAAAAERGVPFVVLDRPNPLGGTEVQGPVLEPAFASFVGPLPVPLRHGMTVGELARYADAVVGAGADLTVVPMQGWTRAMRWSDTPLAWVPPSPNMSSPATALVYPGTVLIEGTNLSEGRGTTTPFELIGAPFVDGTRLAAVLNGLSLPGVRARSASFAPASSKHRGEICHGVQLHVTDRRTYLPIETGLAVIAAVRDLHPRDLAFLPPERGGPAPFDALVGNGWLRRELLRGASVASLVQRWRPEADRFRRARTPHLLYA